MKIKMMNLNKKMKLKKYWDNQALLDSLLQKTEGMKGVSQKYI